MLEPTNYEPDYRPDSDSTDTVIVQERLFS